MGFEIGDRVVRPYSTREGWVVVGPVANSQGLPAYLIELDNGNHLYLMEDYIRPALTPIRRPV